MDADIGRTTPPNRWEGDCLDPGRMEGGRAAALKNMKTASRTLKRGRGGDADWPARFLESGKQAKNPMFSIISRQPGTALPGVRHPAAPRWVGGRRMAHAKSAKSAKGTGGMWEERGREGALKTMKTASQTLKGGREAGIPPVCEWRSGWSTDAGFPDFALIPIMTMAKCSRISRRCRSRFALIPIMTMAKSARRVAIIRIALP